MPLWEFRLDHLTPEWCSRPSLFSCVFLPQIMFQKSLFLSPSLCFYTFSLMGLSWWGNILHVRGSLHSWSLGWFLSLGHCSSGSNRTSSVGLIALLLEWFSSNLCLTLNLVFDRGITPRHYLLSSGIVGFIQIIWSWTCSSVL